MKQSKTGTKRNRDGSEGLRSGRVKATASRQLHRVHSETLKRNR